MKNTLFLVTSSFGAQCFPLLALPLLSRLYSPADYGIYAVYISSVAIISSFSSLRYELAIPLPTKNTEAAAIVGICLLLTAVVSISSFFIIGSIDILPIDLTIKFNPVFLSIGVLTGGSYNILAMWLTRNKKFNILAISRISQSCFIVLMQLLLFKLAYNGLILGSIFGYLGALLVILKFKPFYGVLREVTSVSILFASKRYKDFPLVSSWSAIASSISNNSMAILLSSLASNQIAGIFSIAYKLIGLPSQILVSSVATSSHKDLAEANLNNTLSKLMTRMLKVSFFTTIYPVLFLCIILSSLSKVILGPFWSDVPQYLLALCPIFIAEILFAPMSTVISVKEWQKIGLIFQLLQALFVIGFVGAALKSFGPFVAVITFSGVRTLSIFAYRLILIRALKLPLLNLVSILLNQLLLYIPPALMLIALSQLFAPITFFLTACSILIITACIYFRFSLRPAFVYSSSQ